MRTDLIIAGVGGQGSIMAGTLLGTAAVVFDNKKALQTQSYSSELRGGAAVTWVIVSDEVIVYPRVVHPDILVAQAPQAVTRYLSQLKPCGTLIIDSDMVQDPPHNGYTLIQIPATSIANREIGNSIVTNLLVLGVLIGATRVVSPDAIEKAIHLSIPKPKVDMNLKAFRRGLEIVSS
ncbi:MAG: 2-oxoacid:ferredoxin oxidoreductase subunit gamma [Proteobacteria bacterium]|nr:2-oxoacid:ferredoxin oxidoreductase subunit gamma [Pseudomonadota bacterium]NIS72596.1 2-oxoacid:ferredoxin oxidoreductase subunit gamma [Pseudomonadota bacterium]